MLYIRADGNADIGMGHVMRCLSVAEAAAETAGGSGPVFITADGECRDMIADRGFRVIVLHTDYKDMMTELPLLGKTVDRDRDVLLVDSYQVSREYFGALKRLAKVACLEDMGFAYPVDLLINYNIYAPWLERNYKTQDGKSGTADSYPDRVLLGVDYMPLRKAFQKSSGYVIKDKITDVIITTGGSDPCFAAAAFVEAFLHDGKLSEQDIKWHIISGPFNTFADRLKSRYEACENVVIHENVKDMRGLLLQSDVVVTAAGSTVYEVASLGIPMIVFYFAENQRQGAEALEALTDIVNAGCFAKAGRAVTDKTVKTLHQCMDDKEYRVLLNTQEKKLVDGRGASRIAAALMELMQNSE